MCRMISSARCTAFSSWIEANSKIAKLSIIDRGMPLPPHSLAEFPLRNSQRRCHVNDELLPLADRCRDQTAVRRSRVLAARMRKSVWSSTVQK
jgi:hypothetical protein